MRRVREEMDKLRREMNRITLGGKSVPAGVRQIYSALSGVVNRGVMDPITTRYLEHVDRGMDAHNMAAFMERHPDRLFTSF